jgi:hypothetical protein
VLGYFIRQRPRTVGSVPKELLFPEFLFPNGASEEPHDPEAPASMDSEIITMDSELVTMDEE